MLKKYVIHIRNLKQILNHGLVLKTTWILNSEKSKKKEKDFEKDFGKTMENARKHRDIKVVTTNKRRNYLVSEPTYHTTKWFLEDLLAIEMKKIKVKMNKPMHLDLSILETAKHWCMNFGMIILNQSISKMKNYVTWIQTALVFILQLKMFMEIL